ncbi:cadherin-like protein 26 [Anoplopoma fimbria]|uniref:cadherin-like protein 26 n=1 Tax=Anoplopoma fimbria TaxID=229290 RepID=UPI0023ED452E|nr:cadherin-like protein 26 [Anoplopoma fimbria]
MRTIFLLLLVALTALAESHLTKHSRHAKRELLVRSKRRWVLSTIEIEEEDIGPFPKRISKMFNDVTHSSGQKYLIRGKGVDETPTGVFSIDENSGIVYAHKSVNREEYGLFEIKFDVLSKDTGIRIDDELSFNIEVKDINDNPPTITMPEMPVDVNENTPEGFLPVSLQVTDKDVLNNSKFDIIIISQEPQEPKIELKQIDSGLTRLSLKGCFNYHKAKEYEVVVQAKDHGKPSLSSTAVITLNIVNKNSNRPTFREKKYSGEVVESTIKADVLRIEVDDKDTPKTPAWRAKYFFMNKIDNENYKLETDPETNDGILSVIKGMNFDKTTSIYLLVGVENEEPFFLCENHSPSGTPPPIDTVNITMTVIDVNDPPDFGETSIKVYRAEEAEPGDVLYTPKVRDDSDESKIRYVLREDSANWLTINEKTGEIKTTEKMDRESAYVKDDKYKVIIEAIDTGEPPATGTCTVLVHLGDINDNNPGLVNKSLIMCGNKDNKVMVPAMDADASPFSGPFTFSLGSDDKALTEQWKLDPSNGMEGGLVSLVALPYDTYLVPLVIQDQQTSIGEHIVEVVVCDCEKGDVCRAKKPKSSGFGAAAIGLLFLGLLLFLLLLLLFKCQCRRKDFKHIPMVQDEGYQSIIKYNQEGGGSACMSEPTLLLTPTNTMAVTDGLKMGTMQRSQTIPVMAQDMDMYNSSTFGMRSQTIPVMAQDMDMHNSSTFGMRSQTIPVMAQDMDMYNSSTFGMMNPNMTSQGMQRQRDRIRSNGGQTMRSTWGSNRMNTYQGGASRYNRSVSLQSSQHISDHIDRRLHEIGGNHVNRPVYAPYEYAYEGQGSRCLSLENLSLSNHGDDLMFLNDLGPKFKTLAGICHKTIQEKNVQL